MQPSMHAVGFRRYGAADVLEPLSVPRPTIGPNDVLIRVIAAGINPADWRLRSGQFRFVARSKLPFIPGSDVAGVVHAVGSDVTQFRPGDAVYAMLPSLSGGGYAEYAATHAANVALMPSKLSFVEAAAVPLTALTALQALRDKAQLQPGAHVLIHGASGGVGTFAVQIAKALGAHITATSSARNIDLIRSMGADNVLDYASTDVTAAPPRYDVVFDAVNAYGFRRWRRALKPGGVAVTVNPIADKLAPDWLAFTRGGRRLRSVMVQPSGVDLATIGEMIAAGQVRPVIDQCYPLNEAAAAHRYSETQRVRGKLVLVVAEQIASQIGSPQMQPQEVLL